MKLYNYDHCPFCTRAKMILNLTNTSYEDIVLLNDDEKTPISLCGKKQLPILEDNDKIIIESLDIVDYIDGKHSFLSKKTNKNISVWLEDAKNYLGQLIYPRLLKLDLPEFKTQSAIEYFRRKKEALIGMKFEEALENTTELKSEAEHHLKILAPLVPKLPSVKNKDFSKDDIMLFPILRLISCVYALKWEKSLQDYVRHISTITRIPLYKGI